MSFDNTRVLHGRKGFTISGSQETVRHLESTFVDLDEINSKRRILKEKLNIDRFQWKTFEKMREMFWIDLFAEMEMIRSQN